MITPLWVAELADHFWDQVGEQEPFPRWLRSAMTKALPLSIVEEAPLSIVSLNLWLGRLGIATVDDAVDRPLRACLVARAGTGLIFVDASDPIEEQRFSVAHELSHFLRDYQQIRDRAISALGNGILEVLDGKRPPRPEERLHSTLSRAPIGAHVHLLRRNTRGALRNRIARSEVEADRLAWELLAPASTILVEVEAMACDDLLESTVGRLQDRYGFPLSQARQYARALFPPAAPRDTFFQKLRKKVKKVSRLEGEDQK